jgi:hypothetical protein
MGGPEDPVLRWAFLVHRNDGPGTQDLEHFDEAIEKARRAHPELLIGYVRPLPAFHFVNAAKPAGEAPQVRWGW